MRSCGSKLLSTRRLLTMRRSFATAAPVMTAAKVELTNLPLVDVAPLVNAARTPVAADHKTQILADMKAACLTHGFFTVPVRDVIPGDLVAAAYRRTDEFLALPDAVKQQYHCKKTPNNRGWTPMFEEPSVRYSARYCNCCGWCADIVVVAVVQYQPDVVSHLEGFDLARELPASFIKEGSSLGPNTWPAELPGFQRDVYALYEETTKLSTVLFQSFAEMFGLPADTFTVTLVAVEYLEEVCANDTLVG